MAAFDLGDINGLALHILLNLKQQLFRQQHSRVRTPHRSLLLISLFLTLEIRRKAGMIIYLGQFVPSILHANELPITSRLCMEQVIMSPINAIDIPPLNIDAYLFSLFHPDSFQMD